MLTLGLWYHAIHNLSQASQKQSLLTLPYSTTGIINTQWTWVCLDMLDQIDYTASISSYTYQKFWWKDHFSFRDLQTNNPFDYLIFRSNWSHRELSLTSTKPWAMHAVLYHFRRLQQSTLNINYFQISDASLCET
jgi:hypothetical protein